MSKITFRADNDLVERVEALDISKSEVMREALRAYLETDGIEDTLARRDTGTLDALVEERVDAMLAERLDELIEEQYGSDRGHTPDVNVTLVLEGATAADAVVSESELRQSSDEDDESSDTAERAAEEADIEIKQVDSTDDGHRCSQCGETLAEGHVFCPNCGEKASRRVFCECGDEVRTDWSYCPGCGRRTPAADVLDQPS